MSENIPSTSASSAHHHRRNTRKYDKSKLPTPPPDPTKPDDREDFLAYLESLQKAHHPFSRSTSVFAPAIVTEDAFDHLEKLYKLMEQLLELKVQNAKLHRRVQDLEHLHNLEKMHHKLTTTVVEAECPELDKDTAFAETILESILAESKNQRLKPSTSSRLRQSMSRKHRTRSISVSGPSEGDHAQTKEDHPDPVKKPSKVSKWTKVKSAFKWEKASPTVSDAKSQDSGIGGMLPVNVEVARYLRVPSTCDDAGHSPADSGAAEISTPGTLSTASSAEDFHRNEVKSPSDDLRISSDDEQSHNYIPHSKSGSQKSNKSHKTPWAKMKDIIQTRNSFKKKHRLSSHSDEIHIDVELCSDNEEVFDDEDNHKNISPRSRRRRDIITDIPIEIVERYQRAISEDQSVLESDFNKPSKWTRVKNAFLPPLELNPSSPKSNRVDEDKMIEDEIQRNYQELQKKLSIEFQEKLSEWERTKQNSPSASNQSSACGFEESRDPVFLKKIEEWQKMKSNPSNRQRPAMTSEENLPPEFRKKLQEWEKIRKCSTKKKLGDVPRWKSMHGQRSEAPAFEYPPLSEDFKKKLEEWKQIKSGNCEEIDKKNKEIKSSPRLSRKNSSPKQSKKSEKELQWFEKELSKIEKEKHRLEREHQKFLEREESLSKLRSSVVGGLKKEVLIHTPSGFYKFQGISSKFAQKLYEWEKARGISPESSTFTLLNSSLTQDNKPKHKSATPPLTRCKSADSIAVSALNLTCPLMTHIPSSLSLNDVEDLEKKCLANSSSLTQFTAQSQESLNADEPEALIIEIEDIEEETAAPLRTHSQRTQQAVYHREEIKAMCEGETCIAPKVRRSESARAQNSYNLIEEIFSILRNLTENELEIEKAQELIAEKKDSNHTEVIKLKMFDESQKAMSFRLANKVMRLQEANSNVFSNITQDDSSKHVFEELEAVQDLSSQIIQFTEKLDQELEMRNVYDTGKETGAQALNPILDLAHTIRNKMLDLRRNLSYVCAASDMTAPRRNYTNTKKKLRRNTSIESKDQAEPKKSPNEGRLYIKAETSNIPGQGAVKKRIRYRQKSQQSKSIADTDEEEDIDYRRNPHKKLSRTRSVSESSTTLPLDDSMIQKVVVPTEANIMSGVETSVNDSPVTLFVKTTRKLFTPLVERSFSETAKVEEPSRIQEEMVPLAHLPPLPASPIPQRKLMKDMSPSIRLMLAKYNQKISEQDSPSGKSGGSSGSASPVAWRSPAAERRVKAQTERYQESLNNLSPLLGRREVQKSASVGFLHNNNKQVTVPRRAFIPEDGIMKCSSASAIGIKNSSLSVIIDKPEDLAEMRHSPEIRLKKLQKAKEEFLKGGPSSAPVTSEPIKYPARNRLSQISVGSESSYECSYAGALMKSASAGMINIEADAYRQFDPEVHGGGYVSLPRCTKSPKNRKFAFSNIASKFRKVKMRRGKDRDPKMNAVSTLCRQSLVVDIHPLLNSDKDEEDRMVSMEDVSSSSSRSGSWLKKPKLFRKSTN